MYPGQEDPIAEALLKGASGAVDEAACLLDVLNRSVPGADAAQSCLTAARHLALGEYEQGIELMLPALRELESLGYAGELCWAYASLGFAFGALGDPSFGLGWVDKAIIVAERSKDSSQLRRCYNDKASLLSMLDEYEAARGYYERALSQEAQGMGELERGGILNNLAYSALHDARRGDLPSGSAVELASRALGYANEALVLFDRCDHSCFRGWVHYNRGSALTLLGNYPAALAELDQALSLAQGRSSLRVEVLVSLGRLQCDMGQYDDARLSLDEALRLCDAEEFSLFKDSALASLARLSAMQGAAEETLKWSELRVRNATAKYRRHLRLMERNTEVIIELERARIEAAEAQRRSRYWRDAAMVDPLTRCLNRRGYAAITEDFGAGAGDSAVIMMDIDHFKGINDAHGHELGDEVLSRLGAILRGQLRDGDALARYGGEEFIACVRASKESELGALCERIRGAVEDEPWRRLMPELSVTISLGAALRAGDQIPLDELRRRADEALYRAKSAGRNRYMLYA